MDKPKNPPGRPHGTTQHEEKATCMMTLRLTPKGLAWVKAQGRGFLSQWIEKAAREEQVISVSD